MLLDIITSSEGRFIYIPGFDEPLHLYNPLSYLFTNSHDTHKSPKVRSAHPLVNQDTTSDAQAKIEAVKQVDSSMLKYDADNKIINGFHTNNEK